MKTILLSLLSLLFISFASASEGKGQLRHVVMFKFKADAKAEQIANIEKHFATLPEKIDTIIDFEWGTNVSTENKNDGLTHCFFVSFKDQAGLDVYSPHPAHQAFVKELLPILDKVVVIDYVAK
jgi:quinol monooxygenase YgiN